MLVRKATEISENWCLIQNLMFSVSECQYLFLVSLNEVLNKNPLLTIHMKAQSYTEASGVFLPYKYFCVLVCFGFVINIFWWFRLSSWWKINSFSYWMEYSLKTNEYSTQYSFSFLPRGAKGCYSMGMSVSERTGKNIPSNRWIYS